MKRLVLLAATTAVIASCGPTGGQKKPASFDPVSSNVDFARDAGAGEPCVKTGCSGHVCAEAESDMMTTCEMRPEYACYQSATCERQADGSCGWTQTEELTSCLASPPPL